MSMENKSELTEKSCCCKLTAKGLPHTQDTNPPGMPIGTTVAQSIQPIQNTTISFGEGNIAQVIDGDMTIVRQCSSESGISLGGEFTALHDRPSSSVIANNSLDTEETFQGQRNNCSTCKFVFQEIGCTSTEETWRSIREEGPDPTHACHNKYVKLFFNKLKDLFPNEEGLKNTSTINLFKSLLGIDFNDLTAVVKLPALIRLIKLLGPIRQEDNGCVLVSQIHNLKQKSLKVRTTGRKRKISWFVGDMSRVEAEKALLVEDCKDKTFLIRISSSDSENGDFVLSVRHEDHCHHLKIQGDPDRSIHEIPYHAHLKFAGREFASLPDVVEYIIYKRDIEIDNDLDMSDDCSSVSCSHVYTKSPLNSVMSGYERTR